MQFVPNRPDAGKTCHCIYSILHVDALCHSLQDVDFPPYIVLVGALEALSLHHMIYRPICRRYIAYGSQEQHMVMSFHFSHQELSWKPKYQLY